MDPNSRKNDDCYFYYYSTCLKGDNCLFRHEENALGCEVVCQYWKEGKCLNERCNFRHMELKKNRKVIPCYWETQPSGCRKPHCPFRHMNQKDKPPDKSKDGNVGGSNMVMPGGVLNVPGSTAGRNPNTDGGVPGPTVVRGDLNYAANPVDPIVVKFEEESDNESVPSSSPFKSTLSPSSLNQNPSPSSRVKTLEEIKLERIQEQSAAYYNFDNDLLEYPARRVTVLSNDNLSDERKTKRLYADFKVLTLDEIRKNRQKRLALVLQSNSDEEYDISVSDKKLRVEYENVERKKFKSSILPDSTSEMQPVDDVVMDAVNITNDLKTNDDTNDSFLITNQESTMKVENDRLNKNDDDLKSISLQNNNCKEDYNHDEAESHNKQKPIKLRRFLSKRKSINEEETNIARRKLKRMKINIDKDALCSSSASDIDSVNNDNVSIANNDTNDNLELSLTSSPLANDDQSNDFDSVDILKDIDDLLND